MTDRRPEERPDERRERRLVLAGWAFAVGTAVHTFDHLRRGQGSVTEELYWLGNVALVVQVVVITLIVTRHRLAPLLAASFGLPLAIGFFAAHWLPEWSAFSDPLYENGAVFSYVASTLEIGAALAVGAAGLAIVRARGMASFGQAPAPS